MPQFSDIIGELSPMIRGLTVSIIMLASAISSTVAGVLAHHFGHLAVIGMGACIFTVGVIFEGAAYVCPKTPPETVSWTFVPTPKTEC